MGTIKINETAREPIDMKKNGSNIKDTSELIMPIEHYVTVSAKVENDDNVSVEGAKSAPRKKTAGSPAAGKAGAAKNVANAKATTAKGVSAKVASNGASVASKKKALALPAGSIGAAVLDEKEKAKGVKKVAGVATAAGMTTKVVAGTAKKSAASAKLTMDGMVKPKARTVEVTEIEPMDIEGPEEGEFEAHRPKEKQAEDEENDKKPRFSKPKALLIGVGVTLAVAIVGGVLVGLFNHKEAPRCLVRFESNGGSKIESEEVVCGETVGRPEDPTKEGFEFQNWIYGGAPFDFDQMTIDEDMILVAKWQVGEGVETVTVHFDTNGGSEIEDVEVKKGGTISEPVEPTRTSYEFAGWKLDGEDFDFSQPLDEDVTLVAQWTAVAGGSGSSLAGGSSNKPAEKPKVESLAVGDVSMKVGDTKMIDLTLTPGNAKYQLGVSVDGNIATCTVEDGPRLRCVGKGAGETTAILRDNLTGKSTQFKVKVVGEVTFVKLDKDMLTLYVNETGMLSLEVTTNGGGAVATTWTTSNPNIATVDANGKVTAVAVGKVRITATAGGMSDVCEVTVITKPVVTPPTEPEKPDPDEPGEDDKEGDSGTTNSQE